MTRGTRVILMSVSSARSVNTLLRPVVPALISRGWTVDLICDERLQQVIDEIRVQCRTIHSVPLSRALDPIEAPLSWVAVRRAIRQSAPDVVVAATPKAALFTCVAARTLKIPTRVFHIWGARWDAEQGVTSTLLRRADAFCAINATDVLSVSDSLADTFVDSSVVRRRPIVLGAGGSKGVDLSIFYPSDNRHFDEARPTIGFVGRLAHDKGIDYLLRVFRLIRQRIPAARLELVGAQDPSQPIDPVTARALHRDPGVAVLGGITASELAERMRSWHLHLFPSRREGLPNAVIEAAACGVPTVGWDVTGVRDAVRSGESGLLVPFGDEAAMAEAALSALDPVANHGLSLGAKEHSRAYDSEVVLRDFCDYLEGLYARQGANSA